ncbi:MAG: HAD family hydrolase [Alphaproteobacteria bacterium]
MGTPPRPRAILFDWDNTLVDNWLAIHAALNAALAAMGRRTWSFEEARGRVRRSLRDSFPEMFGERWKEAGEIFYARFAAVHLETLKPLPGSAEMVAFLAETGVYLGVVSNKTGEYLRREAAHLGWDTHFARLVGATDAAEDKPAVAAVELALAGSGIERGAEVWFVGDGAIDMECAHNAGCSPVLLSRSAGRAEEIPSSHGPIWRVEDCMELVDLVRDLYRPYLV